MKEIIYVLKQGSKIRRKDNQLIVFLDEIKIAEFPVNIIECLFIFGNIEITTSAVNFLLSKNIDIYLVNNSGKLKGIISSTNVKSNFNLRIRQYKAHFDNKKNIEMVKFFVNEKLLEICKLSDINYNEWSLRLKNATSYNEILGIEGSISHTFFKWFKEYIGKNRLGFEKRQYNPAPDPVNSVLSFTYTLIYNLLYSKVLAKGYDPYLGFLHKKKGTHAAFVSDVMESFRPEVTKFVGDLIKDEILTEADFVPDLKTFYFKESSLKNYLRIFNEEFLKNGFLKKKADSFFKKLEVEL